MKSLSKISVLVLALFTLSTEAFALPARDHVSFIPESTAKVDFEGILAIRDPFGGCSASLVRYDMSRDDDHALVLTNGHCYEGGFMDPGTYILNKESHRKFKILNPADGRTDIGTIQAEKVVYGTMTKSDMTLYRLTTTYREIQSTYGIRPLTLAAVAAIPGTKIEIASGYWRRGYACEIESIIPTLKEGDWTWKTSLRYSRPGCETIGGTSGSPIVESGTRTVVGINNTGNESGQKCTINNPCEVDRNGNTTYEKGVSYGQQTFWLYSCLDKDLNFDLAQETCRLPGGKMSSTESVRIR